MAPTAMEDVEFPADDAGGAATPAAPPPPPPPLHDAAAVESLPSIARWSDSRGGVSADPRAGWVPMAFRPLTRAFHSVVPGADAVDAVARLNLPILDAACGNGYWTATLRARGVEVIAAVDPSSVSASVAAAAFVDDVTWAGGDAGVVARCVLYTGPRTTPSAW